MILTILPTRNRPKNIERFWQAWQTHSRGCNKVIVMADTDDPDDYTYGDWKVHREPRLNPTQKLNRAAALYSQGYSIIGFIGDDVVIETPEWDKKIEVAMSQLGKYALLSPSDGYNRHTLPNHFFISKALYDVLGWMIYPKMKMKWSDHIWRAIGKHLIKHKNGGYLRAMDIVLRHRHPAYDQSVVRDQIYKDGYDPATVTKDKTTYWEYMRTQFASDMRRLA